MTIDSYLVPAVLFLLLGPAFAQRPRRDPAPPTDGGILPAPPPPGRLFYENTGLARSAAGCQVHFEAGRMIFWARETSQDLNGDGDVLDDLLLGYDLASQGIDVVDFAPSSYCPPYVEVSGRWLVGAVSEFDPITLVPLADLNGDGDTADSVLHTHDFGTRTSTNLGIALENAFSYQLAGDLAVYTASEAAQGGSDLNGDGDALDAVRFVRQLSTATTHLLVPPGADLDTGPVLTDGTVVLVSGVRFGGGPELLYAFEPAASTWTDLGPIGSPFDMRPSHFVLRTDEAAYGGDLNGDGDSADGFVYVLYDRSTGSLVLPGLSGHFPTAFAADRIYVSAFESQYGDLNGDGDAFDAILHSYAVDGTIQNLGLKVNGSVRGVPFEDGLAIPIWENQNGQESDLNGDGDQSDFVMHAFDERNGTVTNLGLAMDFLSMDFVYASGRRMAFPVDEADQSADLDGSGTTTENVMFVYNADAGIATNTRLPGVHAHLDGHSLLVQKNSGLALWSRGVTTEFGFIARFLTGKGPLVYMTISETEVGQDLDGDGLLQGMVVHNGELR